jgi:hypothetical protein
MLPVYELLSSLGLCLRTPPEGLSNPSDERPRTMRNIQPLAITPPALPARAHIPKQRQTLFGREWSDKDLEEIGKGQWRLKTRPSYMSLGKPRGGEELVVWSCVGLMAGQRGELPAICQREPTILILGTINPYQKIGGGDRIRAADSLKKKLGAGHGVLSDEPKATDAKVAVFRASGFFEWGRQTPSDTILVVIPRGTVEWDRAKATQARGTDWIVEGV